MVAVEQLQPLNLKPSSDIFN